MVVRNKLRNYSYANAAFRFPSLTSLTTATTSDAAIEQLVQLPRLEELRFPQEHELEQSTTARGFSMLHTAPLLRSFQYSSIVSGVPKLAHASLTSLFSLTTPGTPRILPFWLSTEASNQLFTRHRLVHLRCLELLWTGVATPQTIASLLPLVKPADVVVAGREQRQAARATKRQGDGYETRYDSGSLVALDVPAADAANFPVLECLTLHHSFYYGLKDPSVSWIRRQLRRSYEYEVAAELGGCGGDAGRGRAAEDDGLKNL